LSKKSRAVRGFFHLPILDSTLGQIKELPMRKLILVLWPSFLTALLATTCFFSVFDPYELALHGKQLFRDQLSAYSVFFLLAWFFGGLNGLILLQLNKPARDINGFDTPPVDPDAYLRD
jgi:hypothetical protein